jgi:IS1 family transposase
VRLPQEKVCQILHCLVEGNSVRGTARLCDVEKRTVLNILKLAGDRCQQLLTDKVRGVTVGQLQLDEIWTLVKVKQGHLQPHHDERVMGDAYTFIALDRTSKLVVAWHLGKRDRLNTEDFISKVRWATEDDRTFDICTDGFGPYSDAIDAGLSDRANYTQVVKNYSKPEEGRERYSPGNFVSVKKAVIIGDPDVGRASTSHVERKNGTLRQWCKRLTRLTYAFSKKWENLQAALALHFAHYNFCRQHGSLNKWTPAMAAGITDRVWEIDDLLT